MVYTLQIPQGYKDYNICHLEMLNIIVASKIWAIHWTNRKIQIHCDNMAVVQVLNTGKTRDPVLATCARNLWLLAATYNIEFLFTHIAGKSNGIADFLSWWAVTDNPLPKLTHLLPGHNWVDTHIDLTLLNYDI